MRILIIANKLPYPPRDGGSIATLNMITGLRDAACEVTCLAMNTRKHPFPVEQIPSPLRDTVQFIGVSCDNSIRPLKLLGNLLFSRKPYIAQRFKYRAFRRVLEDLLKNNHFDVVQLEGPYPGHYLPVIRKESRARIALRAHNVEHLIWMRKALNEKRRLTRWYLKDMASRLERFEKEVTRKVDCVVTISSIDEEHFRNYTGNMPIITIPAGLNLDDYPVSPVPGGNTVFFIGALDWLPNQEGLRWFLKEVLDTLLEEIPDLTFHVAGRNVPDSFRRELRRKGVSFHGEVEDSHAFMQSCRVMVAPLFTGSGIRVRYWKAWPWDGRWSPHPRGSKGYRP
ncbi:MAG: glycosyltransferase [Bacteroidetes bacterium]|nr:MAG: glycosyltransferase [Bacteroidota bacterium]